jgi:hypothetical protein
LKNEIDSAMPVGLRSPTAAAVATRQTCMGDLVHLLAHSRQEDEKQRYSHDGVQHAHHPPRRRPGRNVAVACTNTKGANNHSPTRQMRVEFLIGE